MQAARSAVLIALLCGAAFSAQAQWQWVDRDGHKVFSDRAPPPDVPERNILKQPGGKRAATDPAPALAAAPAAPPASAPAAPKLAGKDAELDARRKASEDAEAQKKKAEEERMAAVQADNCQRARQSQATLDSGIRVAQINEQGERIIMDDAARAAETQRVQAIIASDCH